jgi:hypothetical protein
LPVALSSEGAEGDAALSAVVRLPLPFAVTSGAWEADRAATATAATVVVTAALRSLLSNCAAIE